jgi:transposase
MSMCIDFFPAPGLDTTAMNDPVDQSLFPIADAAVPAKASKPTTSHATPRLRRADRRQSEVRFESLDERLPMEHSARALWQLVQGMDLSPLYQSIKAVEGIAGRDATDPKILMAVWLFAFSEGESSARRVARLCRRDRPYEWLCGGVSLNHRLLAEFRVAHWDVLDKIFTDGLGALMHEGLIDLNTTAQDGMRVRASAGTSSFRREATLEECLANAKEHITQLHATATADPSDSTRRHKAARERAAQERLQRVEQALENVKALQQQRETREKGSGEKSRASTTDPEARKMKMPDGGYRPAFNVQFATDVNSGLIVGVDVNNQGSDAGLMDPMLQQVEERTQKTPTHHLADGGFSTVGDIQKVTERGTIVITPIKEKDKKQKSGIDPFAALPKDSPEVGAWRQRMGTEEAQTMYKLRAQAAELSNAHARNRGFYQVRVRGLAKVKVIALWYALVHNLLLAGTVRAKQDARASDPATKGVDD